MTFTVDAAYADVARVEDSHSTVATLRLSDVIGAFSYALDLTEGQPAGHCVRSCWLGFHLGRALLTSEDALWDLYYTLLLKDAGCSSNAARLCELYGHDDRETKYHFKFVNNDRFFEVARFVLEHTVMGTNLKGRVEKLVTLARDGERLATELIQTRCERGAAIARQLGFNEHVALGIHSLDEHWNGNGRPAKLAGDQIPLNSQIALLAQVADVFFTIGGAENAIAELKQRRGTWFNPNLVNVFLKMAEDNNLWNTLRSDDLERKVSDLEPKVLVKNVDENYLDAIATAFGQVVDSKSPYTYGHSTRVALYAEILADKFLFSAADKRCLRRAALLHDLGKLGVSNSILDKPSRLDEDEWRQVRLHPQYTEQILARIEPFKRTAQIAGAHHERLDGKGYYKGLSAGDICLETRIITVSDIFDALHAERPYRAAMPIEKAMDIMTEMSGTALDSRVVEALRESLPRIKTILDQDGTQ